MSATILVVEDEEASADIIREVLEAEDYQVVLAPTLFRARGALSKTAPDLIILDRRLPDGDGLDLCKEIKSKDEWKSVPILFLSARKTVGDKVKGLELGGDDYLAKPFDNSELVARVHSLLRQRGKVEKPAILQSGLLRMDLLQVQAFLNEKPLKLWPKEFELLRMLLERKNRVLSRAVLMESVWGYEKELEITSKTVDVTVSRLRKKLGDCGKLIEFVRGYGYRYTEPAP